VRQLGEVVFEIRQFRDHLFQAAEIGRVKEEIDVRKLLFQFFLLLGHHAPGQHEWHVRLQSFQPYRLRSFGNQWSK
jgi:hypothetical protein